MKTLVTEEILIEQGYPLCAQFFSGIQGLAYRLSYMYGNYHLVEDFKQTAIGVAARLEKQYNPEAGASFYTFITPYITNEIFEMYGTAKKASPLYKEIERFANQFLATKGRYPNLEEIQEGLDEPLWKIKSIFVNDIPREVPFDDKLSSEGVDPVYSLDLDNLLDKLSEQQRPLVIEVILNEQPIEVYAITHNIPVQTAELMLGEAKNILRELLSDVA